MAQLWRNDPEGFALTSCEAVQRSTEVPGLRIVDEALWERAHARLGAFRDAYIRTGGGKLIGRPSAGVESKYLLTGHRGTSVCKNGLEILMDTADRAVLDTLSEDLLQPEVIERAIDRAVSLVGRTAHLHPERG